MKNIFHTNDRNMTKDKKGIKGNYTLNFIKYSLIF